MASTGVFMRAPDRASRAWSSTSSMSFTADLHRGWERRGKERPGCAGLGSRRSVVAARDRCAVTVPGAIPRTWAVALVSRSRKTRSAITSRWRAGQPPQRGEDRGIHAAGLDRRARRRHARRAGPPGGGGRHHETPVFSAARTTHPRGAEYRGPWPRMPRPGRRLPRPCPRRARHHQQRRLPPAGTHPCWSHRTLRTPVVPGSRFLNAAAPRSAYPAADLDLAGQECP